MKLLIPTCLVIYQVALGGVGVLKGNKFIITGYISGSVSALSPEEAKEKIEKGLIIYPDWYVAHGVNILDPIYKIKSIENEEEFFENFRISYKQLKANPEVVSICSIQTPEGEPLKRYGSEFIILSECRIAILWDGLYIIYE